jgi:broad specificity phosphatase PhoE
MAGRVLMLAHGRTAANAGQDEIQSWSQNPLDETGREEAARLGRRLQPEGVELLLTSDLKRAEQTADIIGRALKLRPKPSAAWRPWKMGPHLTGMVSEQARPIIEQYVRTPGRAIPGGESLLAFRDRLLAALERLLKAVKETGNTVVVATHSRDISLAQDWLAAAGDREHMRYQNFKADRIHPGALLEIRPRGDGYTGRLLETGGR